jgi:hypothetical protein
MLTYRSKEKDRFYFKNLDRVDEEELFLNAKTILNKDLNIKFYKYEEIVELNIWNGKYKNIDFQLCHDIDYGPFVICQNTTILNDIEKIINIG